MVSVTVTNPDGTKKAMPGMKFRVKNVPNPRPTSAGRAWTTEHQEATNSPLPQGVIAKMDRLRVRPQVRGGGVQGIHDVGGNADREDRQGAAVSGDMKEMFQKAKPGQKVFIENIKANGPDGPCVTSVRCPSR
jgi:hypothetical protein